MKHVLPALRIFLILTVLTGFAYPLAVTVVARLAFPKEASGNFLERDGKVVGSKWIGQKFVSENYFRGRPSSVDYNPMPSGASNLGPTSEALRKTFVERAISTRKALGLNESASVPQDLLFASASGLDPEISPESAEFQVERVLKARGQSGAKEKIEDLIRKHSEAPQFGLLGEPRVNVLELNLALDEALGRPGASTSK